MGSSSVTDQSMWKLHSTLGRGVGGAVVKSRGRRHRIQAVAAAGAMRGGQGGEADARRRHRLVAAVAMGKVLSERGWLRRYILTKMPLRK